MRVLTLCCLKMMAVGIRNNSQNYLIKRSNRFGATRRAGFLPLNFIRRTELLGLHKYVCEARNPVLCIGAVACRLTFNYV